MKRVLRQVRGLGGRHMRQEVALMRKNPLPCRPICLFLVTAALCGTLSAAQQPEAAGLAPSPADPVVELDAKGLTVLATCWTTDLGFCSFDSSKEMPLPQLTAFAK